MSTNTLHHISDDSKYKNFDPTGTAFPSSITNVQDALASLDIDGIDGVPNASQTIIGKSRFATNDEAEAGLSETTAISPSTLNYVMQRPNATETKAGVTRYATNAEAVAGTVTDAAIVASSLDYAFVNKAATELKPGTLKISTTPAAIAGVDDTTSMSPLKVAQAIADATGKIPTYALATKTIAGIVRMATIGEAQNGTAGDGVAISPETLHASLATTTLTGVIRLSTNEEVADGTSNNTAITPASLLSRKASVTQSGLVKLTTNSNTGDDSTALRWDAAVLKTGFTGSQQVTGHTNFDSASVGGAGNQVVTVPMMEMAMPIGGIVMWGTWNAPLYGHWHDVDGWNDYVNDPNPIWNRIKQIYPTGLPDWRGLFTRSIGRSGHMNNELGWNCGGWEPGQVQSQMLKRHKHVGGWGEASAWGPFGQTAWQGFVGQKGKTDWDNFLYYTNDGSDFAGPINSAGLIGEELRPWNVSVRYLMRVA